MSKHIEVAIIGGGPTGLGAAHRLSELGFKSWEIYERHNCWGGLARSYLDPEGFTWDIGGHVLFSHYEYFDNAMNRFLSEEEWLWHDRKSFVYFENDFIPYPFQDNIALCSPEVQRECLEGIIRSNTNAAPKHLANFRDWIDSTFGPGIAKHFMLPYNEKVWAYPPEQMDFNWIAERVSVPDIARTVFRVMDRQAEDKWGPNRQFRFPITGGTGKIWERCAEALPADKLRLETEVLSINASKKELTLRKDGELETITYGALINTTPLDMLVRSLCKGLEPTLAEMTSEFRYSSTNIVGIGLQGTPPDSIKSTCWMYFPQTEIPFYRGTVFSNYSPNNVPGTDKWSLMLEVSESPHRPVNQDTVIEETANALLQAKLIERPEDIVSRFHCRMEYGYPTPFLGRAEVLDKLLVSLEEFDIFSRGRFGAWKYEVSNQDHSFMQGVEVIDRLLLGREEISVWHPAVANSKKKPTPFFHKVSA